MAETVAIERLGHEGDGMAETAGGSIFVPYALPGETVEIERLEDRGTLLRVLSASPDRVTPPCRHFGACGGCALQHWADAPYRDWKREQVVAALAQRGIDAPVAPLIPVPPGSRRRAVFSAATTARGPVFGFSRRASHEILPIEECPVLAPAMVNALPLLRRLANLLMGQRGAVRLSVTAAANGLDIAAESVAKGRLNLPGSIVSLIAASPAVARLSVGGEEIFRSRRPEIDAGGLTLLPPPGAFLQASAVAEAALAAAVDDALGRSGPFADLFAGIGTFSLRLARRGAVQAVESDTAAVDALQEAARKTKGLKPVAARRRDLFRNPMTGPELKGLAGVVFDPPRAGAKAQAEALAASAVPRLAAVSCNPATFARDARILLDGGYRLTGVQPVDQFLWSPHVELVGAFER